MTLRASRAALPALLVALAALAYAQTPPPSPAPAVQEEGDDAIVLPESAAPPAPVVTPPPVEAPKPAAAPAKPEAGKAETPAPKAEGKKPEAEGKSAGKKAEGTAAAAKPEAPKPEAEKDAGGLVEVAPDTWSGGVSAVGEAGAAPEAASSLLGELYKDKPEGFELRPPAGWTPAQPGQGAAAAFRGPATDGFAPTLTVEIERPGGQPNIEAAVAERKRRNGVDLSNYQLLLEHYSRMRGRPAAVLSGSFFADNFKLRNYQVILDAGPTKCVLSYVAPEADFENFRKVFRESALTFDWSDAREKPAPTPNDSFVTVE